MTAKIIDGKAIASEIRAQIADDVLQIKEKFNVIPTLAVILVGSDPASEVYVANKEKTATSTGIKSLAFRLPATVSEAELIAKINELNH